MKSQPNVVASFVEDALDGVVDVNVVCCCCPPKQAQASERLDALASLSIPMRLAARRRGLRKLALRGCPHARADLAAVS